MAHLPFLKRLPTHKSYNLYETNRQGQHRNTRIGKFGPIRANH